MSTRQTAKYYQLQEQKSQKQLHQKQRQTNCRTFAVSAAEATKRADVAAHRFIASAAGVIEIPAAETKKRAPAEAMADKLQSIRSF